MGLFNRKQEEKPKHIWLRVDVYDDTKVSIQVNGLEQVNVCLASFLTKGISYAQQKYNEYQEQPTEEKKEEQKKRRKTP